jgi:hypothetical protein
MRYVNQPDIEFDGVVIKDELPLQPKDRVTKTLENYDGDFLDNIAQWGLSRLSVWFMSLGIKIDLSRKRVFTCPNFLP